MEKFDITEDQPVVFDEALLTCDDKEGATVAATVLKQSKHPKSLYLNIKQRSATAKRLDIASPLPQ